MPEERHDVEPKSQNATPEDTPQQEQKWRSIDWIAGGTFIAEVLWGSWWLVTQVFHWCSWNPRVSTEHFAQFYCGVGLGILSVGYLTLILWPIIFNIFKQGKDPKQDNDPRWFHARILSSGIVGGSYAFLLPAVMSLPEGGINSGGAAALRQAILLATGGLIALIALGETRRKNDNDREAAENLRAHQENMLIQQKEQFEANAFKERKAERRERYTKAVEQLGDEKSPIRMGGVYTLVGLVDEWLEEESIRKYEDRLKEGQVIINNLCAYIRSPFPLYARYDILFKGSPNQIAQYFSGPAGFYDDKSKLESEIDIRLNIIKEIHERLQGEEGNLWGAWSNFEYNFSGSVFFYPVNLTNSYYKKPVTFTGSTYQDMANFSGSTYWERANFSGSTYTDGADFRDSTYQGRANFGESTYEQDVIFSTFGSPSTYQEQADFSSSTYRESANFHNSTYTGEAYFGGSTYTGGASFGGSTYQWANFGNSTYTGGADFRDSTYRERANFSRSTYKSKANFNGSIFYQETYFDTGLYNSFSCFTGCAPQFYDETNHKNTLFGSLDNNFTVENGRGYPIYRNLECLPLGCKFLNSEQKEYLADKFREIEKTNNKILEVKDPKEKAELSKNLQALTEELHEWREEVTTVEVEDGAIENMES